MNKNIDLIKKLEAFVRKHYKNLLIKGCIYFLTIWLAFFILISVAEHFGNFNVFFRKFLFWGFVVCTLFILIKWVLPPIKGLLNLGKTLTKKEAAKIIGNHFSEVEDKLINLLELSEMKDVDMTLVNASIKQKTKKISFVPFLNAIDFKENLYLLKYTMIPVIIILLLFFTGNKKIITESSARIVSYNTNFVAKAPFDIVLQNEELVVLKGENLLIKALITGKEVPEEVYIVSEDQKNKAESTNENIKYLFKTPQKSFYFQFWSNGFYSKKYYVTVLEKPIVKSFEIIVTPPKYTELTKANYKNKGNIVVPEGSEVVWKLLGENSNEIDFIIEDRINTLKKKNNLFEHKEIFYSKKNYSFSPKNNTNTGDKLTYSIKTISDQYPSIVVKEVQDSSNNSIMLFEISVSDDYGIRNLTFNYKIISDDFIKDSLVTIINVEKEKNNLLLYSWAVPNEKLDYGSLIEFYFEVWDNDEINGYKSTKSELMKIETKSEVELENELQNKNTSLKNSINEAISLSKEIQDNSEVLKKELLSKKDISWQEKEKLRALLNKKQSLKSLVKEIQTQQNESQRLENKINEPSEEILKKQKLIDEIFKDIMNDELEELFSELEKMMDNIDKENLQELLQNIQLNDDELNLELDRSLELFKKLELEQKIEKSINDIDDLAKKQTDLAKDKKSSNLNDEKKEQEKLISDFKKIQEDLNKINELNNNLDKKEKLPDTKENEEEILNDMKKSLDQLNKKLKNKASKSQNKAGNNLKELSSKLKESFMESSSQSNIEDMHSLRQILENLISMSFTEEVLMGDVSTLDLNDPKYILLIQKQKTLQLNSELIKDSLYALAKRQPQISSVINKEVNKLSTSLEKSILNLEERFVSKANEQQQLAMTSANNLALMLSEALKQMQKDISQQSDSENKKMCNKPNSTGGQGMKELKGMQEELKKQLEKMLKEQKGKNGKGNKGMSKELAKMSAKQEMIKKRMQELRESFSNDLGLKQKIDQMIKEMEQTEEDIVNNNISEQTVFRQREILNKLLDAEKAEREKEEDEKRQSTEWLEEISTKIFNPIKEYDIKKKNQEEILKTVPASLTPFYKKKVNLYFKKNEQ